MKLTNHQAASSSATMIAQQHPLEIDRPKEQGTIRNGKEIENTSLSQVDRMKQARSSASFDPNKLAVIIYGR